MPFRSPFPDVTVPDVPLTDYVFAEAGAYPDRAALTCAVTGGSITYAQLQSQSAALAAGLARLGIGKGDVVAIYAPNMPAYARGKPCCAAIQRAASSRCARESSRREKNAWCTLSTVVDRFLPIRERVRVMAAAMVRA